MKDQDKVAIAQQYFKKADQGSPEVLDLFDQDVELYFPKFGFRYGKNLYGDDKRIRGKPGIHTP